MRYPVPSRLLGDVIEHLVPFDEVITPTSEGHVRDHPEVTGCHPSSRRTRKSRALSAPGHNLVSRRAEFLQSSELLSLRRPEPNYCRSVLRQQDLRQWRQRHDVKRSCGVDRVIIKCTNLLLSAESHRIHPQAG